MMAKETHKTSTYQHLENAPFPAIVCLGENLVIDFINKSALMLISSFANGIRGKHGKEILPNIFTDEFCKEINEVGLSKEALTLRQKAFTSSKGDLITCDVTLSPLNEEGEIATGVILYFSQVSPIMNGRAIDQSHHLLSDLFQQAPIGLVCYRSDEFIVDFANEIVLETWGKKLEEVKGKPIYEIFPEILTNPTINARHKESVDRLRQGTAHIEKEVELVFLRKGKPHTGWYNYIHEPYTDSHGNIIGMLAIAIEVTDQVQARRKLQLVTDALPSLVSYINANEKYELVNRAYETWFKHPRNEVVGKTIPEVVGEDAYRSIRSNVETALSGKLDSFEKWIDYADGKSRFVSANFIPHIDSKGRVLGFIGLVSDLTERKIAEEKLRELSTNLEAKVQERTMQITEVIDLLSRRNEELSKTESLLQQLIDSSIELIAVVDRDLKFLIVNKAFEDFVQISRKELIGKEIFVAYEGARGSKQVETLHRSFAGETVHLRVNPAISRPDVWFDTHYIPLLINDKVEAVIALSRNITDIIKSERELADANRQLKEAQHLSKLGSWEWDVATGTVVWSDEMYHIYGYTSKFPVDFVKATERMSPEDAERSSRRTQEFIQSAIERFRHTGEIFHEISPSEFQIRLPEGLVKLLRSTGKIQMTQDGKIHRVMGVIQDITEIKATEEKLRQLIEELENKNRELESFNYVASHDLKEPLRNIRTNIDLIRHKKPSDSAPYLSKIDRAAERMSNLIESILKLSEVSNAETKFGNINLDEVLRASKTDLESRINETGTKITSQQLPNVIGNESQITQVFSNLLANSIKFCKESPVIQIKCEKVPRTDLQNKFVSLHAPHYWRVAISDNGIGFDPKYKDQIFEPFQRLHGKSQYGGTGIGLSIVKRIIEKHNGFIDAESETGKGATFLIWLPAHE